MAAGPARSVNPSSSSVTSAHEVLEAVAITIVFTKGSIFKRLRESGPALWRELADCPLCAGVWIGMIWHLLRARPDALSLNVTEQVLAAGVLTGVGALILSLFIALLDRWA